MNTDELANAISSRVDPELKTKIVGVREWIEGDRMKAYIRVQRRFLLDEYKFVLVLAALDVYEEEDRGRGLLTALLDRLEPAVRDRVDGIVVESVNNQQLAAFLRRRGYQDTDRDEFIREVSPTLLLSFQ
ncbi:hypothetical protein [Salipiger sp. PrR003]|uniref:hypothetical protein n=1 Tax=Salipiger sp. PrR003 TaxID=2706776 RepID=UPI0013DB383C|nr:hypothetical protein [Salipiger sp. PrR003]NDV52934.1 hypothetical protein [Salipiger sp. PrR003]